MKVSFEIPFNVDSDVFSEQFKNDVAFLRNRLEKNTEQVFELLFAVGFVSELEEKARFLVKQCV